MHLARFSEFFGTNHAKRGRDEVVIGRQVGRRGRCVHSITWAPSLQYIVIATVLGASEALAYSVEGDQVNQTTTMHIGARKPARHLRFPYLRINRWMFTCLMGIERGVISRA